VFLESEHIISFKNKPGKWGTATVILKLSDIVPGYEQEVTQEVTIVVEGINSPPTIPTSIPDQYLYYNVSKLNDVNSDYGQSYQLRTDDYITGQETLWYKNQPIVLSATTYKDDFEAVTIKNEPDRLTWNILPANPTLVSYNINGDIITLTTKGAGTETLTFELWDDGADWDVDGNEVNLGAKSVSQEVTVKIIAFPEIYDDSSGTRKLIAFPVLTEDQPSSSAFSIESYGHDLDPGDTLTWYVMDGETELESYTGSLVKVDILNANKTIKLQPLPNSFGIEIIRLRLKDSFGLTDEQDVTIEVKPVNDAPIILNKEEFTGIDTLAYHDKLAVPVNTNLTFECKDNQYDFTAETNGFINEYNRYSPGKPWSISTVIFDNQINADTALYWTIEDLHPGSATSYFESITIDNDADRIVLVPKQDARFTTELKLTLHDTPGTYRGTPLEAKTDEVRFMVAVGIEPHITKVISDELFTINEDNLPGPNQNYLASPLSFIRDFSTYETNADGTSIDWLYPIVLFDRLGDNVVASDGDNYTKLIWSAKPFNLDLIKATVVDSDLDKLEFTPIANAHGTCLMTITVSDSYPDAASDSVVVQVTINPVNDNPIINPVSFTYLNQPNVLPETFETYELNLSDFIYDVDGYEKVSVTRASDNMTYNLDDTLVEYRNTYETLGLWSDSPKLHRSLYSFEVDASGVNNVNLSVTAWANVSKSVSKLVITKKLPLDLSRGFETYILTLRDGAGGIYTTEAQIKINDIPTIDKVNLLSGITAFSEESGFIYDLYPFEQNEDYGTDPNLEWSITFIKFYHTTEAPSAQQPAIFSYTPHGIGQDEGGGIWSCVHNPAVHNTGKTLFKVQMQSFDPPGELQPHPCRLRIYDLAENEWGWIIIGLKFTDGYNGSYDTVTFEVQVKNIPDKPIIKYNGADNPSPIVLNFYEDGTSVPMNPYDPEDEHITSLDTYFGASQLLLSHDHTGHNPACNGWPVLTVELWDWEYDGDVWASYEGCYLDYSDPKCEKLHFWIDGQYFDNNPANWHLGAGVFRRITASNKWKIETATTGPYKKDENNYVLYMTIEPNWFGTQTRNLRLLDSTFPDDQSAFDAGWYAEVTLQINVQSVNDKPQIVSNETYSLQADILADYQAGKLNEDFSNINGVGDYVLNLSRYEQDVDLNHYAGDGNHPNLRWNVSIIGPSYPAIYIKSLDQDTDTVIFASYQDRNLSRESDNDRAENGNAPVKVKFELYDDQMLKTERVIEIPVKPVNDPPLISTAFPTGRSYSVDQIDFETNRSWAGTGQYGTGNIVISPEAHNTYFDIVDLGQYESDIDNTPDELVWTIRGQKVWDGGFFTAEVVDVDINNVDCRISGLSRENSILRIYPFNTYNGTRDASGGFGTATIKLWLQDKDGALATKNFDIIVERKNEKPRIVQISHMGVLSQENESLQEDRRPEIPVPITLDEGDILSNALEIAVSDDGMNTQRGEFKKAEVRLIGTTLILYDELGDQYTGSKSICSMKIKEWLSDNNIIFEEMDLNDFTRESVTYGKASIIIPNVTLTLSSRQKIWLENFVSRGGVVIGIHDTLNFQYGSKYLMAEFFGLINNPDYYPQIEEIDRPIISVQEPNDPIFEGLIAKKYTYDQFNGTEFYVWNLETIAIIPEDDAADVMVQKLRYNGEPDGSPVQFLDCDKGKPLTIEGSAAVYHIYSTKKLAIYTYTTPQDENYNAFYSLSGRDLWLYLPATKRRTTLSGEDYSPFSEVVINSYQNETTFDLKDFTIPDESEGGIDNSVYNQVLMGTNTKFGPFAYFINAGGHKFEVWNIKSKNYPLSVIAGMADNQTNVSSNYTVLSPDMKKFVFPAIGKNMKLSIHPLEEGANISVYQLKGATNLSYESSSGTYTLWRHRDNRYFTIEPSDMELLATFTNVSKNDSKILTFSALSKADLTTETIWSMLKPTAATPENDSLSRNQIYIESDKPIKPELWDESTVGSAGIAPVIATSNDNVYGLGREYTLRLGANDSLLIVLLDTVPLDLDNPQNNKILIKKEGIEVDCPQNTVQDQQLKKGMFFRIVPTVEYPDFDYPWPQDYPPQPNDVVRIVAPADIIVMVFNQTNTKGIIPYPAVPNKFVYDTAVQWTGNLELNTLKGGTSIASLPDGRINVTRRKLAKWVGRTYFIQTGTHEFNHQWDKGSVLKDLVLNAVKIGKPDFAVDSENTNCLIKLVHMRDEIGPFDEWTADDGTGAFENWVPTYGSDHFNMRSIYRLSVIPKPTWAGEIKASIQAFDGIQTFTRSFYVKVIAKPSPPYIEPVVEERELKWWNSDWRYRTFVVFKNKNFSLRDYLIEYPVNFSNILKRYIFTGATPFTFEPNSVRVIEVRADQVADKYIVKDIIEERATQFVEDDDFDPVTNAKGKVLWVLTGDTPPYGERYFHIYFDIEKGKKWDGTDYASSLSQNVKMLDVQKTGGITRCQSNLILNVPDEVYAAAIQYEDLPDNPGVFITEYLDCFRDVTLQYVYEGVQKGKDILKHFRYTGWTDEAIYYDWTEQGPHCVKISPVSEQNIDDSAFEIHKEKEEYRRELKVKRGPEFIVYSGRDYLDIKLYTKRSVAHKGSHFETYWKLYKNSAVSDDLVYSIGGIYVSNENLKTGEASNIDVVNVNVEEENRCWNSFWSNKADFMVFTTWNKDAVKKSFGSGYGSNLYVLSKFRAGFERLYRNREAMLFGCGMQINSSVPVSPSASYSKIVSPGYALIEDSEFVMRVWLKESSDPQNEHLATGSKYHQLFTGKVFEFWPAYTQNSQLTVEALISAELSTREDESKVFYLTKIVANRPNDCFKYENDPDSIADEAQNDINLNWGFKVGDRIYTALESNFAYLEIKNATSESESDRLIISPKKDLSGEMTVTLALRDETGLIDTQKLGIKVKPENDPPEIVGIITGVTNEHWESFTYEAYDKVVTGEPWYYKVDVVAFPEEDGDALLTKSLNLSDLLNSIGDTKNIDPLSIRVVQIVDGKRVEVPVSVNMARIYVLRTKQNALDEYFHIPPPGWENRGYYSPNKIAETLRENGIACNFVNPEEFLDKKNDIDLLIITYGSGIMGTIFDKDGKEAEFMDALKSYHANGGSVLTIGLYPFYDEYNWSSPSWVNRKSLGKPSAGVLNGQALGGYYFPPTDASGNRLIFDQQAFPGQPMVVLTKEIEVDYPLRKSYVRETEEYKKLVDLQSTKPDAPLLALIHHDENYNNSILAHIPVLPWSVKLPELTGNEVLTNRILLNGVSYILNMVGKPASQVQVTWLAQNLKKGEKAHFEVYFDVSEHGDKRSANYGYVSTQTNIGGIRDTRAFAISGKPFDYALYDPANPENSYCHKTELERRVNKEALRLENDFIVATMKLNSIGLPEAIKLYNHENELLMSAALSLWTLTVKEETAQGYVDTEKTLGELYNNCYKDITYYYYNYKSQDWELFKKDSGLDFRYFEYQQCFMFKIVMTNHEEVDGEWVDAVDLVPKVEITCIMTAHDPFLRFIVDIIPDVGDNYAHELKKIILLSTKLEKVVTAWEKATAIGYTMNSALNIYKEGFEPTRHYMLSFDDEIVELSKLGKPLILFYNDYPGADGKIPYSLFYSSSYSYGFNGHRNASIYWEASNNKWVKIVSLNKAQRNLENFVENGRYVFAIGTLGRIHSSGSNLLANEPSSWLCGWSDESVFDIGDSVLSYYLIKEVLCGMDLTWITLKNDFKIVRPKLVGIRGTSVTGGELYSKRETKFGIWNIYDYPTAIGADSVKPVKVEQTTFTPRAIFTMIEDQEEELVFDLSSYMSDQDTPLDKLIWEVQGIDYTKIEKIWVDENNKLHIKIKKNATGSTTITLVLKDDQGAWTSADVTLRIIPVNDPPPLPNKFYIIPEPWHILTGAKFSVVFDRLLTLSQTGAPQVGVLIDKINDKEKAEDFSSSNITINEQYKLDSGYLNYFVAGANVTGDSSIKGMPVRIWCMEGDSKEYRIDEMAIAYSKLEVTIISSEVTHTYTVKVNEFSSSSSGLVCKADINSNFGYENGEILLKHRLYENAAIMEISYQPIQTNEAFDIEYTFSMKLNPGEGTWYYYWANREIKQVTDLSYFESGQFICFMPSPRTGKKDTLGIAILNGTGKIKVSKQTDGSFKLVIDSNSFISNQDNKFEICFVSETINKKFINTVFEKFEDEFDTLPDLYIYTYDDMTLFVPEKYKPVDPDFFDFKDEQFYDFSEFYNTGLTDGGKLRLK